jgi:hypothetical protein
MEMVGFNWRLPFVELLLVQLGPVIEDTLLVIAKGEHLHLDVELPAGLISRLDASKKEHGHGDSHGERRALMQSETRTR